MKKPLLHSPLQKSFALICLPMLLWSAVIAQDTSKQLTTERPNILWLVTEDNSKHYLRLYEKNGAPMPNLEALAKQGVVFEHAFSQAPVCSVARSTIISGCYAPRIGAQYHRRTELVPMPEGLEMFPYYLRQAGYYTTNNQKEDYNLVKGPSVWDDSSGKASYRNRKEGQPFFHVQNFGITHEGQLHFTTEAIRRDTTRTDPASVEIFPYHPDTPESRYTYARYHDLHQRADEAIGEFLTQLEADGLMNNTVIFYYADHGGVLPRSKGYLYESGLHVPMVVYAPPKWQHLLPVGPGGRVDAFVRFIDLAPTVLNLAGIDIPDQMDGRPFLGQGVNLQARNTVFSYADRFDEKYDLVRAVRKGKYKYIRNYQPFNFDGLHNFYRYRMLLYQQWRAWYEAGRLNSIQSQFFEKRDPEALYDLENDPHELNNLAGDPSLAPVLKELRELLQQQVKSLPDLSFIPEPVFLQNGLSNPVRYGQRHQTEIAGLVDIADLSLLSFARAKSKIGRALRSDNSWQRYWALIVCSSFGKEAAVYYDLARKMLKGDPQNLVRVRAAEFLGLTHQIEPQADLLAALKRATSPTEANLILNTITMLKDMKNGFNFDFSEKYLRPQWLEDPNALISRRVEYLINQ